MVDLLVVAGNDGSHALVAEVCIAGKVCEYVFVGYKFIDVNLTVAIAVGSK